VTWCQERKSADQAASATCRESARGETGGVGTEAGAQEMQRYRREEAVQQSSSEVVGERGPAEEGGRVLWLMMDDGRRCEIRFSWGATLLHGSEARQAQSGREPARMR
jgi:hypothetical protein